MRKEGIPGVEQETSVPPEMVVEVLTTKKHIGKEEISKASQILMDYKTGKANLENRIVEDELWYRLRHWEALRMKKDPNAPNPASAWLFNAILNKHADAMDNYPTPVVLPRERADEAAAKMLGSVLPVILEQNNFDATYSKAWWDKLIGGTSIYGVFWDSKAQNGLGDITIQRQDILNVFWEPGVENVQDSKNLFIVKMVDNDILQSQYPQLRDKSMGSVITVAQYMYDEEVDLSDKSLVVDWYYKMQDLSGKTVLHYCKYVGDTVLYASEDDPACEGGYYAHGKYPVVFDVLFPEKGMPTGFGYVSICRDPQMMIDSISADIAKISKMRANPRYWKSSASAVNSEEFLDWSKPLVTVEGELDDRRIRPVEVPSIDPALLNIKQQLIEEMKDTAANRDINSGGAGSGVTAAAAIAALQEAGNKVSRDMIGGSWRAYIDMQKMITELMAQFYDVSRPFRITGEVPGDYQFIDVNNDGLADQIVGMDSTGLPMYRHPIFDYKIMAQKKSPFSRMEQNERAKELYSMGFFAPENATPALGALQMMDFEGIDKVIEQVKQGETLLKVCQQLNNQVSQLLGAISGVPVPPADAPAPQQTQTGGAPSASNEVADGIMSAQAPQTPYAENLAKRSTPSMEGMA